jgi:hypothetical protein
MVYSSVLKMETICSSETSVDFQRTTWRYIPEDRTFHKDDCENLESYIEYTLAVWIKIVYFLELYKLLNACRAQKYVEFALFLYVYFKIRSV